MPRAAPVGGDSIGPQLRSKILCQVKQSLFFPGAATYRSHWEGRVTTWDTEQQAPQSKAVHPQVTKRLYPEEFVDAPVSRGGLWTSKLPRLRLPCPLLRLL